MRARLRDERGLTLVELLVGMTLGILVLGAVLTGFERFAGAQQTASEATAAQDTARAQVRATVAELREARVATGQIGPIPAGWTVTRSDLVFATYVPSGATSVPGWVRYCTLTSGTTSSLVRASRAGDTWVAPGACAATGGTGGWTHQVVLRDLLQQPGQLFDYASDACVGATCLPAAADVRAVGIRVAVARRVGSTGLGTVVRGAVSFRNRPAT
ncbi:hypothetical protein GKE82_01320 [Conexibacter sp. W3-3-2]|uniref:PilW family protein n=1 Tax=Conexibacter sp. W3-3-2 TaxID=2675227 RepID=UPI0012B8D5E2|nr:prepilin-type N-terminal cleavage/methylation domain-containing protein [Conexibacter sp. W3-3-2]MTD42979.1 hypothetical protein [Conexibacter sp. W3-3-2]